MSCKAIFLLHAYKEGTVDSPGLPLGGGFFISASAVFFMLLVRLNQFNALYHFRNKDVTEIPGGSRGEGADIKRDTVTTRMISALIKMGRAVSHFNLSLIALGRVTTTVSINHHLF